jgi:hypothetical protein
MLRSHGTACDSKSGIGSYTQRQLLVVEQCLAFCLPWKFYIIDCFRNMRSLSLVYSEGSALPKQKPGPDPSQTDTQPISQVASCSVPIREFCNCTNCWLTDIVIRRPTNQSRDVFHDPLSSEKKNGSW